MSKQPMKRWKKIVSSIVLLSVVAATVFVVPTVWGKPWSIDHFYARTFLHFALEHPMMLTQMRILEPMGLDGHNDDLDDMSIGFQREQAVWLNQQLDVLHRYDRDRLDDQLSYDVLDYFLTDMQNQNRFLFHGYPVNQLFGVQSNLPDFMINTHQVDSEKAAEQFVARLTKFGVAFDQVIEDVEHRRDEGIVPPRFVIDRVLTEMNGFIADPAVENPLYTHFDGATAELDDLDEDRRTELLGAAETAIIEDVYPAYERLIATMSALGEVATTDDGVWKLPDGDAFYEAQLRTFTSTDLTAEEIHRLGLTEVEKIQAEMRAILEGEGYEVEDLAATVQGLYEEERFQHPDSDEGREQILTEFQEIIDEIDAALDPMFDLRPEAGVRVERIPEFKQETSPGAYYNPPPFDGSKPGIFYANLRNVDEHAKFTMRTLAYHEAVPGHHFQIALAMEMEGVPFFRRVVPFTAFVEGWALYSEKLAAESGFQDDPYDRIGYLQAQLFRAVRLVVDTGIHAKRWTREEAIDYMMANTGMPESDVVAEIERYIVMPGQATAYKVGQLKILELRERAQQRLGDAFDIREFHNVVLGNGSLPLTILERLVDDWVEAVEQGPVAPDAVKG